MARPLRIEFADALYRLTARENAQQDIFIHDDVSGCVKMSNTGILKMHQSCRIKIDHLELLVARIFSFSNSSRRIMPMHTVHSCRKKKIE